MSVKVISEEESHKAWRIYVSMDEDLRKGAIESLKRNLANVDNIVQGWKEDIEYLEGRKG